MLVISWSRAKLESLVRTDPADARAVPGALKDAGPAAPARSTEVHLVGAMTRMPKVIEV